MEDEEFFEKLGQEFKEMMDERSLEALKQLTDRWLRIGEFISRIDDASEMDWAENRLGMEGVNIKALLMFGLRLAVQKNVAPMDYTAAFTSGYLLGYLSARDEDEGDVFDRILSDLPEPPDEGELFEHSIMRVAGGKKIGDKLRTIDEVALHLQESAREICNHFTSPNSDWSPVLLVVTDDEAMMIGVEIPENEVVKEVLFEKAIPRTVRMAANTPPKICGFIVSAWALEGPEHADWVESMSKHGGKIRNHPDRTEGLFMYLRDRDGNAQMWMASILRDGEQPPALGEWKRSEMDRTEGKIVHMFDRIFR